MKTFFSILLMVLLMEIHHEAKAKTSFFVAISGNCKEADSYLAFFESKLYNDLKKNFPCVEISSRTSIATILENERQRTLLGGESRNLAPIGAAMGAEYLVSLKIKILQGATLIEAFCMHTRKNKVISRVFLNAAQGDAALDAVENASKQLVEGLKKYEICPFTGPINVTVKTERTDKKVDSYAVYCNGTDGTFRSEESISSNSLANWKLNKTRKNTTSGSLTYSLFEELTIEEQNPCAICSRGKKGLRILSEKIEKRANISGLTNESIFEGAQIDDARTEIIFLDNGTYTIKVQAASKKDLLKLKTSRRVEGSCENSSTNENINKKADVPLNEVLGPFNGTSLNKVLSGSKTIVREDPETKEKTTITFDFTLTKE